MVGDGSNDISALIMADIGVGIIGENLTVQYISSILTSTWTKIPALLEDFNKRKIVINNICYWVVMKHMLTAFTLVGMLIVSSCDQLKDPTSPYLVIFMNTVLFWYMVIYTKTEENNNNTIVNMEKWKKQGIFLGIFNGLYVFTSTEYSEGITMAIASTLLQLILKLYSISSMKTNGVKLYYWTSTLIVMSILKYISFVSSEIFFGYLLISYIFYLIADKIIK
jgi:magnesium-transporting ATPase (P-type)